MLPTNQAFEEWGLRVYTSKNDLLSCDETDGDEPFCTIFYNASEAIVEPALAYERVLFEWVLDEDDEDGDFDERGILKDGRSARHGGCGGERPDASPPGPPMTLGNMRELGVRSRASAATMANTRTFPDASAIGSRR